MSSEVMACREVIADLRAQLAARDAVIAEQREQIEELNEIVNDLADPDAHYTVRQREAWGRYEAYLHDAHEKSAAHAPKPCGTCGGSGEVPTHYVGPDNDADDMKPCDCQKGK